jgi:hypothetical protein
MEKQTAVEWLVEQLSLKESMFLHTHKIIDQAKKMEKEQISKAYFEGILNEIGSNVLFDMQPLIDTYYNYYNETYKSE